MSVLAASQRVPDRTGKTVRGIDDWTPPHDQDVLVRIVERLCAGLPVDAAYDDLDAVLGEGAAPNEAEIEDLTDRFRGNLMVLVDAVRERSPGRSGEAARLVERARSLRQQGPGKGVTPLAHLRRLALVAQDLLEVLFADNEATA